MRIVQDLLVVLLLLIVAAAVWYAFSLKPLVGGMVFMVPPIIYMGMRQRKPWRVLLPAAFTLGFVLGFGFDFVMSLNGAWSTDRLLIPWKVLGIMPIDNAFGYFLMALLTLTFYEHFLRGESRQGLGRRYGRDTVAACLVLGLLLLVASVDSGLLRIPYAYAVGGSIAMVVTIRSLFRHRELVQPAAAVGAVFFFVWFIAEYAAVATAGWSYPSGEYMGWVYFLGVRYPIEELLFWMLWYSPFLVLGYEHLLRKAVPTAASVGRGSR